MSFITNKPLSDLNTFGVKAEAETFRYIFSLDQLFETLKTIPRTDIHILGGGSNILLTGNLTGTTLKNEIKGIQIVRELPDSVTIAVGGGVIWHDLVRWALQHDFGGIENLSLIPGTVGAAPIQNIGAYGVELQDVFVKLEAVDLRNRAILIFEKADCQFGYRDSIFKRELKGRLFITRVWLKLTKTHHQIQTSYAPLAQYLETQRITRPTIQDVSRAVVFIRQSKLPDPAQIGNAGSFFKNPEIPADQYAELRKKFPDLPGYPIGSSGVKVPAGWLIEQTGWKGRRFGNAGVHNRQALVLVNYGGATGSEILSLSRQIAEEVHARFGISLTPEVNIW